MYVNSPKNVEERQRIAIYWDNFQVNQQVFCKVHFIDYDKSLIIYKPFTFKPWFRKKRQITIRGASIINLDSNDYTQIYFNSYFPMKYGDTLTVSTPFQKQFAKIAQSENDTNGIIDLSVAGLLIEAKKVNI